MRQDRCLENIDCLYKKKYHILAFLAKLYVDERYPQKSKGCGYLLYFMGEKSNLK